MAQLNDLLVLGKASFLDTVKAASLSLTNNLTVNGALTANTATIYNQLTIHRDTAIADDLSAKLAFSIKETGSGVTTNSAYIAAYDDHDGQSYGTNMVITSPSSLIIGGGESASAFYTAEIKGKSLENTYITADGTIYFYTNVNTPTNKVGVVLDTARNFHPVLSAAGGAGSLGTDSYYWNNAFLGTTTLKNGHLYLTGSNASSSANNTTQIVFGTSSDNHIALSANDGAFVINPDTATTTGQVVIYLGSEKQSSFPGGFTTAATSSMGNLNPATNKGHSLGTSSLNWNAVYGTDFYQGNYSLKRLYCSMVPYGTAIPANANLNTTAYIKVGNYYCSANATVATLTNTPTQKAFMMQVYSPLSTSIDNESTGTWVYRIRKIIDYDSGMEYVQSVYSNGTAGNFTYGTWSIMPLNTITVSSTAGTAATLTKGSATKPVYVNSSGKITACSTYAGGTAVTLNNASKAATTASFYAPTTSGEVGQYLRSGGEGQAPTWSNVIKIQALTADPSSPEIGQMWIITS